MSGTLPTFKESVADWIAKRKASLTDGFQWEDLVIALQDAAEDGSRYAAMYLIDDGETKKAAVVAFVLRAYDVLWPIVAAKISFIPGVPFILGTIVRAAVARAAPGIVERMYQRYVKPAVLGTEG